MKPNKIVTVLTVLLFSASGAYAFTYQSADFTLINPRIVSSGGRASSVGYRLENVGAGRADGGKAASLSFSLDASAIDRRIPPDTPTVDTVTSPTIVPSQTLTGTKDKYSSLYINKTEVIPLDSGRAWSYEAPLSEGDNLFSVASKNIYGQESKAVNVHIVLAAGQAEIRITSHQDGATIYAEP